MTVVLDASAILAFVHDEDGTRVVEEVLDPARGGLGGDAVYGGLGDDIGRWR